MPIKFSFCAESRFDFDKAVVKPESKQALDKFSAALQRPQYDIVQVADHTG